MLLCLTIVQEGKHRLLVRMSVKYDILYEEQQMSFNY
jgi:hypothetical protein